MPDPNLVGGLLLRPGTVQHGDGPGRDRSPISRLKRWRSGPATCRSKCSRRPPARSTNSRRAGGFARAAPAILLAGAGPREGSFRVVPEIRDLVKFRHIDLRNPNWPVPADFPDHILPERLDLFCRGRATDTLEPPGAAPAPGGWLAMGNGEILPEVPPHSANIHRRSFRRRDEQSWLAANGPRQHQPRMNQSLSRFWSSMIVRWCASG